MEKFSLSTKGHNDIINITGEVEKIVGRFSIDEGIALISCPGSTCGITTIEYEEGVIQDLKDALERIAPVSSDYLHCQKWGDCNGYAHIRSALIKPFLAIPIKDRKPFLGTWQQIVFIDFDNRPRKRDVYVIIIGKNN